MTQISPHMTTRRPSQRPAPTASPAAAARTSLRQAGYILSSEILLVRSARSCLQALSLPPSTCYLHGRDLARRVLKCIIISEAIGSVELPELYPARLCLHVALRRGDPAAQGIRNAIMAHTNQTLPDPPPQPLIVAYGDVALTQQATLLDSLGDLFPGLGIYSQVPMPMEEYGQG